MTRSPRRPAPSRPKPAARFALHGAATLDATEAQWLTRATWAVVTLLGIALLAMILGPHRVGDVFTETDFYGAYAAGARLIQHGQLLPARYGVIGPGYEVALALVGFVVRDLFLAAELLAFVSTVGALVLWSALFTRRVNARLALVAALFMATNATFFRYGYAATTDAFAGLLQAGALFLLLGVAGPRALAGAGLLAAAAFLTRYNAIALLPAGLLAIFARAVPGLPAIGVGRLRAALMFVAGFLAPVVPWVLFSLANGGRLELQLHHNIAYEVFARSKGMVWDDYQKYLQPQFHSLWDVIARDPGAVFARMLFNAWDHLRLDARELLGVPVAICAALGILVTWRTREFHPLWPILASAALTFATLIPAFYSARYGLALLPAYAALAAATFATPAFALVWNRRRRIWLKPALAIVPLAFAVQTSVAIQRRAINQLPVEVLQAAKTIAPLVHPGDRVIARKPHFSFHSGLDPVPFPFADSLPQLAAYARQEKARWLYFSWPEAEMRPRFMFLLDTTAIIPGLTVRAVTHPHPAVLYEIGERFGEVPAWLRSDTLAAVHAARARVQINPNDVPAQIVAGAAALEEHHFDEARERLTRAARLQPNNVTSFLLLGRVALETQDASAAAIAFERAETLRPGMPEARIGRGWASLLAGDSRSAADLWRPVVPYAKDAATLRRMIEIFTQEGDVQSIALARSTLAQRGGAP